MLNMRVWGEKRENEPGEIKEKRAENRGKERRETDRMWAQEEEELAKPVGNPFKTQKR